MCQLNATLCVKMEIYDMEIIESTEVHSYICKYPIDIQDKLLFLRGLILETASEIDNENKIEETLKWGQPSYTTKNGSTIRIDWNKKNPDQYAIYFHCKTKLIDIIKERYTNLFKYEGNRAIIFNTGDIIPAQELKHCISLSLTYHTIKHLPMLGL